MLYIDAGTSFSKIMSTENETFKNLSPVEVNENGNFYIIKSQNIADLNVKFDGGTGHMTKDFLKDNASLENEISNLQKRLRLKQAVKEKIAEQIDNLDVTDKLYEIKNEDLQSRLNNLYDEIYEIEEQIAEVHSRIDYITQQKVTSDTVYKYLVCFDKLFEKFTEKEKKMFIQSFVERVELFEKEMPNGKFLKSISFKFPVFYNGQEITGLSWDNKKTVETVVLMSKV